MDGNAPRAAERTRFFTARRARRRSKALQARSSHAAPPKKCARQRRTRPRRTSRCSARSERARAARDQNLQSPSPTQSATRADAGPTFPSQSRKNPSPAIFRRERRLRSRPPFSLRAPRRNGERARARPPEISVQASPPFPSPPSFPPLPRRFLSLLRFFSPFPRCAVSSPCRASAPFLRKLFSFPRKLFSSPRRAVSSAPFSRAQRSFQHGSTAFLSRSMRQRAASSSKFFSSVRRSTLPSSLPFFSLIFPSSA